MMEYFKLKVYHGGWFSYDKGPLQYVGGETTIIEDIDCDRWSLFEAYAELKQFGYVEENISALWYKDPMDENIKKNIKLFQGDADAIAICKIAELREYVELFVVHKVEKENILPKAGYKDVGGDQGIGDKGERQEVVSEVRYIDVMPSPYRRFSHRLMKKKRTTDGKEEESSHTHLSRRRKIQRCLRCGTAGHKKERCPKPIEEAQPSKNPKKTKKKTRSNSHSHTAETGKKCVFSQPTPKISVKRKISSATHSNSSTQSNSTSQSKRPKGKPKRTTKSNSST
ncbi:hypothetical protein HN51_042759 [Arachis hypogaea]|uniref:uncharacterized protein LOC110266163 n=1 Tax=Arachis ipaensis TaxID=130454 RepID=UPI000A2B8E09|nr:uncharacterized protein LOC110266163 [Arachis ipaensis]XP_025672564.1 uncharacterized protein LOC112771924 [Arachis hypogaea]QHN94907.1 uncharacterized protein DS421_18g605080 [Arachis hypogaea]